MKYFFLILFGITSHLVFGQTKLPEDINTIDHNLLNQFITKEVNILRKKVRSAALVSDSNLQELTYIQAKYCAGLQELTHTQKDRKLRYPHYRAKIYQIPFSNIGENLLFNELPEGYDLTLDEFKVDCTYEELAKIIVNQWRDSPPHYKTMMQKSFQRTYTSIYVLPDGVFYACQILISD